MVNVTIYCWAQQSDQLAEIEKKLNSLQNTHPHRVAHIDASQEVGIENVLGSEYPLLLIGPYRLKYPFSVQDLQAALGAAMDRELHYKEAGDSGFEDRKKRGKVVTTSDKFSYWLSDHYLAFINGFVFIYVGLPFLAPVLMKIGWQAPARIIYSIYSILCHQLAFRSWFLFGEQGYYPRLLAGIQNVISYETLSGSSSIDINTARSFLGDPIAGFKVALCERDVAIYAAILLFGLVFAWGGRRIKSYPWYLWILIGLIPIGLDGGSQLASFTSGLPFWVPIRESTPLLRTITGGLFGWMTAWYLFPLIEETMVETKQILKRKFAAIRQTVTDASSNER